MRKIGLHSAVSRCPAKLRSFDLPTIRQMGIMAAARDAIAHLSRAELDGFWIHIDADCLDDAVMPAIDFRLPDGLSPQELETVLTMALETVLAMALDSGRAVGLEITIYNPTLDTDGRAGKLLADLLVTALSEFGALCQLNDAMHRRSRTPLSRR